MLNLGRSHGGGNEDDVKVYEISSRPTKAPSWRKGTSEKDRRKQRLKESRRSAQGVQVLQDFELPSVSNRVKCTKDGQFIMVSGTYPPMVRVFELSELSMKFQRNVSCEIVDFQILSEDWRKMAFLLANRAVEFHAGFGHYYSVRVPKSGRDLALHPHSCDLFVCGEGAQVYRLNLEQGRFLTPLDTASGRGGSYGADRDGDDGRGGNNCMGMNPHNGLIAVGGDHGGIEMWDPRALTSPAASLNVGAGITALRFDEGDGLIMGAGTSVGQVLLYDVRSSKPFLVKEQGFGLPIRTVKFHADRKHVLSCDAKSIKAWQRSEGTRNLFAEEPRADINHLCVVGNSGVVLAAAETSRVLSYYIPTLGTAPKWCSFLDNFTEELEEGREANGGAAAGDVYENYRFVTLEELQKLNLEHLLGTSMLRGYMHGYFMDLRLWRRATDVAEPFAYDKYRKEKAKEKVDKERGSRISSAELVARTSRQKVKVNQKVLDDAVQKLGQKKKGPSSTSGAALVNDPRFKSMFEDEDFRVDETTDRFVQLHPQVAPKNEFDIDSDLDVEEEEEEETTEYDFPAQDESSDDSGDSVGIEVRGPASSVDLPHRKKRSRPEVRMYGIKPTTGGTKAAAAAVNLASGGRKDITSARQKERRQGKKRDERKTLGERLKNARQG